ncbi:MULTISPECIES: DUF6106 family protein [Eubacterium]|uniref:Uncharacterized protein n=1 Tax=Eubacterium ruminantium TaxID=42322 RepID=A0A1T4K7R4_9FIRM|nr:MULTISPECIES: DUF6106 family protein [Eubacterium]MCR5368308.1 DUF6106 family protein [Eubacterium sp.]SCW27088.1 hypothetical protein SAMN05660484_00103 [Eubacterium ruminantium]SDM19034.1 hypothetical protein SAMN04490370_101329 [Eubacterium ruminantium]SJZ38355.1 hypothetical protein SAMN02745110_00227 [Eubacterium ruminantium]
MDRYNERLVYGKPEPATKFKLFIAVLFIIGSFVLMMKISMLFFILFVLGGLFFIKTLEWMNLEYEYTLVNGDIQIAKIASAKKRKELMHIDVEDIKNLDSIFSDKVKNDLSRREKVDVYDFTEQVEGEEYYAVYVKTTGNDLLLVLDLDENCLEHMKIFLKSKFSVKNIKKTKKEDETGAEA